MADTENDWYFVSLRKSNVCHVEFDEPNGERSRLLLRVPSERIAWPEGWICSMLVDQGAHLSRLSALETRFFHPSALLWWWHLQSSPLPQEVKDRIAREHGARLVDLAKKRGPLANFLRALFEARSVKWNDEQFKIALANGLPSKGKIQFRSRLSTSAKSLIATEQEVSLLETSLWLGMPQKTRQVLVNQPIGEIEGAQEILERHLEDAVACGESQAHLQYVERLCLGWKNFYLTKEIATQTAL